MKKIIGLCLAFLLCAGMNHCTVRAEDQSGLVTQIPAAPDQTTVYGTRYVNGVLKDSYYVPRYEINGISAYCIEKGITTSLTDPYRIIEHDRADSVRWNALDEGQKEYVSLAAFFGYGYKGEKSYERYVAAQALIWEAVEPGAVMHFQKAYPESGLVNITNDYDEVIEPYKKEIRDLISSFKTKPELVWEENAQWRQDLPLDHIKAGSRIVLKDRNGVLDHYLVKAAEGIVIEGKNKEELNLRFTGGKGELSFTPDPQYWGIGEMPFYLIYNNVDQTLASVTAQPVTTPWSIPAEAYTPVVLRKAESSGRPVTGALLQIIDEAGTVKKEWRSSEKEQVVEDLEYGKTYLLKEAEVPEGYVKANPVRFKVEGEDVRVLMEDLVIRCLKQDEEGNALPGARLAVLDQAGATVDQWTSTAEPHRISGLTQGEIYVLKELEAPEGYKTADEMTFTADKDQTVIMKDEREPVVLKILKKEEGSKLPLEGAQFEVREKDNGKVIMTLRSGKDGSVQAELPYHEGGYEVRETAAPQGYALSGEVFEWKAGDPLVWEAECENRQTSVSVIKTDPKGNLIAGARLVLKDAAGKVIREWTSSGEAELIQGLPAGGSFTLSEIKAPEGYQLSEPVTFTVPSDQEVLKVVMIDPVLPETGVIPPLSFGWMAFLSGLFMAGMYFFRR